MSVLLDIVHLYLCSISHVIYVSIIYTNSTNFSADIYLLEFCIEEASNKMLDNEQYIIYFLKVSELLGLILQQSQCNFRS